MNTTTAEQGREFWRGVLLAGGFIALPRWTLEPVPGIGEHEARIPNELVAAVRRLADELALTTPLFETVFDVTAGDGGEFAEETVLWVSFLEHDGLVLRLRYRTDVLDADCAARVAGYHLTALALIAADPDAEHKGQSLLSGEELHVQLHRLAGPRTKLPDRRVHEPFEERVRAHPDA